MTQTTSDGKKILITLDNVRVIRNDDLNVAVERLENVTDRKTKEVKQVWRFKGYYGTTLASLRAISREELLVDEKAVSDLESYLKQVEESNAKVLEAIERVIWNDEKH